MATQLVEYNTQQDAVTVFFNEQNEPNLIRSFMESLFVENQQYLFFDKKQFSGDGEQLFQTLIHAEEARDIIVPTSERLLFCYYLPLEELTDEWIDRYFEKVDVLNERAPIDSLFNHHYLLCFNYRVGNIKKEEEKERIARLLVRLGTEKKLLSQQIYLIRVDGFKGFESQERALVQLLHLLSRKDYHKIRSNNNAEKSLRMLGYTDYYEGRAIRCREELGRIDNWRNEVTDPGLSRLVGTVKSVLAPAVDDLREAGRIFRKKSQLYPVSVRDFEGNYLKGYRSHITANHPMMERRRKEFTERRRRELVEKLNLEEVKKIVGSEYHFPDYEELMESLGNGRFRELILTGFAEIKAEPEVEALAMDVLHKCEAIAEKATENLSSLTEEKENEKKRYTIELKAAGRYNDLEDCLARIHDESKPEPIKGKFSQNVNHISLVGGKCLENWQTRQYSIAGQGVAYRYPLIKPCEIVELVEYDVQSMESEDAAEEIAELL